MANCLATPSVAPSLCIWRRGRRSLFALFVAGVLVLAPWELGWLLKQGRERTGRLTLDGVVHYRERVPVLVLLASVVLVFVVAISVTATLGFIDGAIERSLFSWVPGWYMYTGFEPPAYSIGLYRLTTPFNILFFGIALPWIEELYFRGFLLPRIRWLGWKAPVLNAALFSLYHMWTPWMAVTRFIFVLPMIWLVHRYRSISIGIWAHCALNTVGILLTYFAVTSAL